MTVSQQTFLAGSEEQAHPMITVDVRRTANIDRLFRHIYPAGLLDQVIDDVLNHRRDGIIADAGHGTLDRLG